MCQVSAYIKEKGEETLVRENVTRLELFDKGVRLSTLFEGTADFEETVIDFIDFSAGRIVLEKGGKENTGSSE